MDAEELRRAARLPDGSLRALFMAADGRVVLRVDIDEGTDHIDELFLGHLVMLIADVGVPAVAFLISRPSGRPHRIDKLLWRQLRERLSDSSSELVDVVVVGEQGMWSAAGVLRHEQMHS